MSLWAQCKSLLGAAFRRNRMEQDLDAELKFHIASYTDDLIRSGIPKERAERLARVELGGAEPIKEECRQALGLRLLEETKQDLRYAARMLWKSPGFAIVAILTLAVGIGLNTAIFSVVDAWVLKPLPYPAPDRLVAIWTSQQRGGIGSTAPADLYDWRQQNQVFEDICGWSSALFTVMNGDEPRQLSGASVNAEFFRMLGVTPQLGRGFLPQEDQPGAEPVAVLSDGLWRDAFASDPNVVGKTIQIDGRKTTVVGILPASFHLPLMGRASVWTPLGLNSTDRADRTRRYLSVIGRTKPGVRLTQAAQQLNTIANNLEKSYPATNAGRGVTLRTLHDEIGRRSGREPTLLCFGLVGCVLLLACANVANLIVGRALRRQQEMAVRLAIGAGRSRLLRQLLTENLVLFLLAAALSLAFAVWGVRWMEGSIMYEVRANLPNQGAMSVDTTALLYTLGIAIFTGLVFGFAPAIHCWRVDVNHGLRGTASRASTGVTGARLKNVLVVVEMSLALVVVVASGLMVKGMLRMYSTDPGFNPSGLVTSRLVLSDSKYIDPKRAQAFFEAILERIRPLPGVKAVTAAQFVPYEGSYRFTQYGIDGQPEVATAERPMLVFDAVTPSYFETLGIPLLRGRLLSDQDRAESEMAGVINETMARRHWPNADPIGQRVRFGTKLARTFTVVGVVKDIRGQTEEDVSRPQAYVPLRQLPSRGMTLMIRAESANPSGIGELARAIRRVTKDVDPGQAVYNVRSMEEIQAEMFNPARVAGQLMTLFGAISLFLAAIGIYSVMAYAVAARKKEFGIRIALGAGRNELLAMVAGQGMKLAVVGFVIGLAGALAATRFMTMILYNVSPTDLPTFVLTSLLMFAVVAIACYIPARQASSADPMRALHHE
jgi:putative ABC transport system permease protein